MATYPSPQEGQIGSLVQLKKEPGLQGPMHTSLVLVPDVREVSHWTRPLCSLKKKKNNLLGDKLPSCLMGLESCNLTRKQADFTGQSADGVFETIQ